MTSLRIVIKPATIELKPKQITAALRGAGQLIASTARRLIATSAGGAGEPPKSRSGTLAASIRASARKTRVTVTASAPYSLALEASSTGGGAVKGERSTKATKGHGRSKRGVAQTVRVLAARPFMDRALSENAANIERRVTRAVMEDLTWKATK